ncbi:copper-transporting ATPase [Streptomyces coelicoflavus]|uniref:copper-transporting ATPase n=1 Tax=Streptomyces coelicoflavus TaxID=285562 RepID=UPI003699CE54
MVQVYGLKGTSRAHFVQAVSCELKSLPGVGDLQAGLPSGKVTVNSEQPLDRAAVAAAVDEGGYELLGGEAQ